MTTSNEHNNAPAVPQGWRDFLTELSKQKPEKPDYWSSCGQCERNSSTAEDLLAATPDPVPAQDEPLGHFRVEPFGWTDCAKDDEGAIALYERPQEVGLTDDEITQVCSGIYLSDYPHGSTSYDIALARAIIAALLAKWGQVMAGKIEKMNKRIERLEGIAMGACFLLQKLRAEYGDDFGAGMTEQVNDCIRDAQQIANNVLQRERQALRTSKEPTK